jgi:hypothetical protein
MCLLAKRIGKHGVFWEMLGYSQNVAVCVVFETLTGTTLTFKGLFGDII